MTDREAAKLSLDITRSILLNTKDSDRDTPNQRRFVLQETDRRLRCLEVTLSAHFKEAKDGD